MGNESDRRRGKKQKKLLVFKDKSQVSVCCGGNYAKVLFSIYTIYSKR